jgi:hypothetical protein
MENDQDNTTDLLNAKLYDYLATFEKIVPKDEVWQEFKSLIEALKFALLNGENPAKLCKRIRRERYTNESSLTPLTWQQAASDMVEVKRLRKLAKAKPIIPGARKLDKYRQEIVTLAKQRASQADIKYWLLAKKGVAVSQPTIHRYLMALESYESQ